MHCASLRAGQRGLSLFGFLFVIAMLAVAALLAMKLVPAYVEFFSVKKILATMGQEPDLRSKSNADIRSDFMRRAGVSYVTVVRPEDLRIDRRAGVPVVSAEYEFRTKLVGNVSLVVDFSASTDPSAAPRDIE